MKEHCPDCGTQYREGITINGKKVCFECLDDLNSEEDDDHYDRAV